MRTIAIESSTHNNTGDAIYQENLYVILTNSFPSIRFVRFEGPMTRGFQPKYRCFGQNAFSAAHHQTADMYILSGPIINQFRKDGHYSNLLQFLKRRKTPYIMLSVCGWDQECISLINDYPPLLALTRDRVTYDALKGLNCPVVESVCAAYFSKYNNTFARFDAVYNFNYITMSFYKTPEPTLKNLKTNCRGDSIVAVNYEMNKISPLGSKLSRHLSFLTSAKSEIDGFKIIRTHHDISNSFPWIIYSKPNSFASYSPSGYLALYHATKLTISDRIHACLPTLAFGNPVIYPASSERDGVFFDKGLCRRSGNLITINEAALEEEYSKFLKQVEPYILS